MAPLVPTQIRYIKLGAGGRWETAALDGGTLEWGTVDDPHDQALRGDWDGIRAAYIAEGRLPATATGFTNEARAFYDGDEQVLWITFARGRMYWAFAEPGVNWVGSDRADRGTRYRAAQNGWSYRDITGGPLDLDRLSTRLTKLAAYRRTICGLSQDQQLLCLRYINAEVDTDRAAVATAQVKLETMLLVLIQRLSWDDFEGLVDLIFARSGWVRTSALGGHQKDVDLIVEQPLTGERMAVQVKSTVDQAVVNSCAKRLAAHGGDGRTMLVYHTAASGVGKCVAADGLTLMTGPDVARHALRAGLVDWIVRRA